MNIYNLNNQAFFKSIKKVFLSTILCYGIGNAWGQQADPFQHDLSQKMFPPTPEQASLLKFTNIPAGNYTGVHGFSVPIYSIQGKEFSLPISINYHGGGIKVDELSGSVGIGWALSVGGISLSEEVRGERDLDYTIEKLNYFSPMAFDPSYGEDHAGGSEHYNAALKMSGLGTTGLPGVPIAELQPDYFSYSLLNNNGRFILDNERNRHTVPKDNVTISEPIIFDSQSFAQQITDSKGIQYYFSSYQQEYSPGTSGSSFQPRKRYSYKIDHITIPNEGVITFDYYQVSYKYTSSKSKTNKYDLNSLVEQPTGISEVISTITEYLPKSVSFKQIRVDFKYKMATGDKLLGRVDVNEGGSAPNGTKGGILEYIEVWDINNNTAPLKKYKLHTDYFEQNPRLKLDRIEDIIQGTYYDFKYIGEEQDKFLPPRFSFSQDYWGMYNGKTNSTSVPEAYYQRGNEIKHFPGANKNPDENFAVIGSLESVKLPTGGIQEFEYELDEFRNVEFDENPAGSPVHNFEERYFEIERGNTPINQLVQISVPAPDYREGFNHVIHFDFPCNPHNTLPPDVAPPIVGAKYFYLELHKGTNDTNPKRFYKSGEFSIEPLDPTIDYYLKVKQVGQPPMCGGLIPELNITASVSWTHDYVSYPDNLQAGTLRVKSITLKDSDGNPRIKKRYSYTDFDNPNHSSGYFTGIKPFPRTYVSSYTVDPLFSGQDSNEYLNVPDNGILNINSSFGKSIFYRKVTETYERTQEEIGQPYKKQYIFSAPLPLESYELDSPIPIPHKEYYAGLILEERIWNDQNQLLKVTKNHYNNETPDLYFNQSSANYNSTYPAALSPSLTVVNTGMKEIAAATRVWTYTFKKAHSFIESAWVRIEKTVTEDYKDGVKIMSDSIQYQYSPTYAHLNPISVTQTNSFGQEVKTEYEYNHPYKKDEPTTVRTYENGAATSVQQTTFQAAGLPQYVFAKRGASTLDNVPPSEDLKVTYDRYDANGNLEQYTLENGTPVSIIWGYNGQYPIVKIEGTKLQDIDAGFMQELRNLSNADADHCAGVMTECEEAKLRKRLNEFRFNGLFTGNNSQITTYTYDPLVGVTSITTPNGQIEYYKYDSSGRLMHVKDHNGNIIKKIDYHYKD